MLFDDDITAEVAASGLTPEVVAVVTIVGVVLCSFIAMPWLGVTVLVVDIGLFEACKALVAMP